MCAPIGVDRIGNVRGDWLTAGQVDFIIFVTVRNASVAFTDATLGCGFVVQAVRLIASALAVPVMWITVGALLGRSGRDDEGTRQEQQTTFVLVCF